MMNTAMLRESPRIYPHIEYTRLSFLHPAQTYKNVRFLVCSYNVSSAEELTPTGVIILKCLSLPFPDGTEPLFIAFYAGGSRIFTVVLQRRYNCVTVVPHVVSQWCYSVVTVVL
jgi:hypothetical protein